MSNLPRYAGLLEEAGRKCEAARGLDPTNYVLRACSIIFMEPGRDDHAMDFVRTETGSAWAVSGEWGILVRQVKYRDALPLLQQGPPAGRDPASEACLERRPQSEIARLFHDEVARTKRNRSPRAIAWTER